MDELIFLGTGDSMGVPRVYCDCGICQEARSTGVNRRYRSSVLLRMAAGELLIDCGPDWVAQMEYIGHRCIQTALITHAHFDHIAGMPEWADACRWTGKKGDVYAPPEVIDTICDQFPWLGRQLQFHPVTAEGIRFGGWNIEPHLMCHGKNGTSYAYRLTQGEMRVGYCSDAINLDEDQKRFLKNLDILVLGTNFYYEEAEFHTRSVYDMVEAMALIQEIQPRRVYFTHMGHGVDIQANYELSAQITLAMTGMKVPLI